MEIRELVKLQESMLAEQLKIVRRFLKKGVQVKQVKVNNEKEARVPESKSMSKIFIVSDILDSSPTPLHVTEIIKRAKSGYQIDIDRESIVSAISKKVRKGDTFIRTAPNTFGLNNKEYNP